ncbi:hypothetical protein Tco_0883424, partial [Tanacetum coccineum]
MDVTARDEGLRMGVKSCGSDDESHGLDVKGHSVECDGLGLREEEEAILKGQGFGSAPKPERPERVSASRQSTLTTWIDPEDNMVYIDVPSYPPPAPHLGAQVEMQGGLICDHAVRLEELSPALFG